jgi:hypothetical protein
VQVIVFFEKAGVFLLELPNFGERRGKSSNLFWSEAQRRLELRYSLLELWGRVKCVTTTTDSVRTCSM